MAPQMGEKSKSRILFAAVLAAFLIVGTWVRSWSIEWLSAQTIDGLYSCLHWALWLVIIGVIVEEWEIISGITKFAKYVWDGRSRDAISKAWHRRGKIAEGAGFSILVAGLAGEMAISPLIEATQKASELVSDERIADLTKETELLQVQLESEKARTAEANLALQKLKSPRTLGPDRQSVIIDSVSQFRGQRYRAAISQGADDGLAFWESLYDTLTKAAWIYVPVPTSGFSIGRPPAGIPLTAMPGIEIRVDPNKLNELGPAASALGNALHADGTVVVVDQASQSNPNEAERDILTVVIGARVPKR